MDFLITLVNGLSLGGIYAMIALGYTMVYGIAKMLNFAHGDIIMIGAYSIYTALLTSGQLPTWLTITVAVLLPIILCTVLGVVIERTAYRPLRGASPLAVLITAIGVSYLLQGLAQLIYGVTPKAINGFKIPGRVGSVNVYTIVTLLVAGIIMVSLTLFVKRSRIGRAMVAVSEDRAAAQLMGVNVNGIITLTFAIGSALAASASIFYLMQIPSVTPTLGSMPGIKAFTAAVIGGIGSIPGAMLGGILLGVIEKVTQSIPALSPYTVAIEFSLLVIILLVKPSGILGKKKNEKV
jgi:branched-chain amino acid transport system permease protein